MIGAIKSVRDNGFGEFVVWVAHDATEWRHATAAKEWFGWEPGITGTWNYSDEQFCSLYPEVVAAEEAEMSEP